METPLQTSTLTPADLIAQAEELESQKQEMIAKLLKDRETLDRTYDARRIQIASELKALGYVRPRTAKESTGIEQGAKKRKKAA